MKYLDEKGLAHFWDKVKAALTTKQPTLHGAAGQVVGFDAGGAAVAVEGWSNENIILNWDFRNPVNRNGQKEYAGTGYTIDRWSKDQPGAMNILDNCIQLHAVENDILNLRYPIDCPQKFSGKTITYSLLAEGGVNIVLGVNDGWPVSASDYSNGKDLISVSYTLPDDVSTLNVYIQAKTNQLVKLYAAKLEPRPFQTLARQNAAGEWEIIDPPDYDLQYALCSQYSPITGEFVGLQHSNPNLLDNWYFADPINQRGQTKYTGVGYTIDRWMTWYSDQTITLTGSGIVSSGPQNEHSSFTQTFEAGKFMPGVYTLSFLFTADSTIASRRLNFNIKGIGDIANGLDAASQLVSMTFTIPNTIEGKISYATAFGNSKGAIIAGKMEQGPVQTLAHKEGDTWVLNDPPPNKALELAKCQRYQIVPTAVNDIFMFAIGVGSSSSSVSFFFPLPTTMRAKAAINFENLYARVGTTSLKITEITNYGSAANGIWLNAVVEGTVEIGKAYYLRSESPFSFVIDANL